MIIALIVFGCLVILAGLYLLVVWLLRGAYAEAFDIYARFADTRDLKGETK